MLNENAGAELEWPQDDFNGRPNEASQSHCESDPILIFFFPLSFPSIN